MRRKANVTGREREGKKELKEAKWQFDEDDRKNGAVKKSWAIKTRTIIIDSFRSIKG